MHFNSIDFGTLSRKEFFILKDFISSQIEDIKEREFHFYSCLILTAYHKLYNKLKGKENSHVLKKSSKDKELFSRYLERIFETTQEHLEKEISEISNA